MKLFTSKIIRENHYVLYDMKDNIIKYYENYDELKKDINYHERNLACRFNKNRSDKIYIVIDKTMYQLYTFSEKGKIK